MKLKSLTIKNFRCYKEEINIKFDSLTALIGKNDIGKSSILEALEIFFNNNVVEIDTGDLSVYTDPNDRYITISCEFSDLPTQIILDSSYPTTLQQEYLTTKDNTLIIKKKYDCSKKKPSEDIFIVANHPTAKGFDSLLECKEKDLKNIIKDKKLNAPLKGNPEMRKAIWGSVPCSELSIQMTDIPINKSKEDCKKIWDQLSNYMPVYALFQSDRSSTDSDGEVQNPMKIAIQMAIEEVKEDIEKIQQKVQEKAEEIANNTHDVLETIDKNLAGELTPRFSPPTPAKWNGLFSIGLETENGIRLNKRGSGVRRLILVSFFKAEAERKLHQQENTDRGIIYAIEEPETSQHPNNQKILLDSFYKLSQENNTQIILTTHSPGFASDLPADSIRFINNNNNVISIQYGPDIYNDVANTLGVTPDSRVKAFLFVEGPTDIKNFRTISHILHSDNKNIIDLSMDKRIAFILTGGSTLKHWIENNYLKELNKPEIHIYDGDKPEYKEKLNEINSRANGSWGECLKKREIENYLHPDAIFDAFEIRIDIPQTQNPSPLDIPKLFAKEYQIKKRYRDVLSDSKAKIQLTNAFNYMTPDLLKAIDPDNELSSILERISKTVDNIK